MSSMTSDTETEPENYIEFWPSNVDDKGARGKIYTKADIYEHSAGAVRKKARKNQGSLMNRINELSAKLTVEYPIEPPETANFDSDKHRQDWKGDVWRALLLCFRQRYGAKTLKLSTVLRVPGTDRVIDRVTSTEILRITKEVVEKHHKVDEELRKKDIHRVQAGRLLMGPQVLSIMKPRDSTHAKVLNQLLAMAVHADHGIKSHRVKDQDAIPFKLPVSLQPKLPQLRHDKNEYVDGLCTVKTEASDINRLLETIFQRIDSVVISGSAEVPEDEVTEFVRSVQDWETDFPDLIDLVKSGWDETKYAFEVVVAEANEGDLVIWDTWHSTCGFEKGGNAMAKMTFFLHYFPADILPFELQQWHRYAMRFAPYDGGSGRARGAWGMFTYSYRTGAPFRTPYSAEIFLGEGRLSHKEMDKFKKDGYLVLSFRDEMFKYRDRYGNLEPTQKTYAELHKITLDNIKDFFRHVSGDKDWDYKDLATIETRDGAKDRTGDEYFYFTDRICSESPLDPNRCSGKSKLGQGGGKMIAANSGMGPVTTLTNEPGHLAFTYSSFVRGVMASFYGDFRHMMVMPERFRMKATTGWKGFMHIDHAPDIPAGIFENEMEFEDW